MLLFVLQWLAEFNSWIIVLDKIPQQADSDDGINQISPPCLIPGRKDDNQQFGFFDPVPLWFDDKCVLARIQICISDKRLFAIRMIPFVGEAFQTIKNFVPVGGDEVGSGVFYAEHGLVGFQADFRCMADWLFQNPGFISGGYFLTVDQQTGKKYVVRFGRKMQFLLPERNHSLDTTQKHFSVVCHKQRILIDGGQRESVFRAIIIELLVRIVKFWKSLVSNQQQMSFLYRWFEYLVNAVTG